jgi:hypothetical protein
MEEDKQIISKIDFFGVWNDILVYVFDFFERRRWLLFCGMTVYYFRRIYYSLEEVLPENKKKHTAGRVGYKTISLLFFKQQTRVCSIND